MLNPPVPFSEEDLCALLANSWRVQAAGLDYAPVGFGSHHWSVRDTGGGRWFVNVDTLPPEPEAAATRLRDLTNALSVPRTLRDLGYTFTVAPVPTTDGAVIAELAPHFAVSVYAHLDGESFTWQPWNDMDPDVRAEALAVVAELHAVPRSAWGSADTEDFAIPQRGTLDATIAGDVPDPALGPFADPAGKLITRHAPLLRHLLSHHDALADAARTRPDTFVLTHGEPHAGNFMRTDGRLVLIDWDTALIAPPERDLWGFGVGDPARQELYSLHWDLAETAVDLGVFSRPHTGDANERAGWINLADTLANLETTAARIDPSWTSRH
ncbi:aminoglycoside phosphotransferase [Catenulispora acidiphila DSM 44928]|uniref:Aminoglycoside phosphotransferase n=1 Tax=Catenulispora acidiphila (strain DSM 44928 / JCM 14897 / NBRC 102108 / NRRL B-24433 / ID139908) TaxID=479433 RepID=C7QJH1_CATAD|nr:aminoglycoside phosphotransferase [Catenulispora acidiphila DSM 44928]